MTDATPQTPGRWRPAARWPQSPAAGLGLSGALLCAASLLLGLLSAWLLSQAPLQLDVGAPGDSALLRGAFPAEVADDGTTFRWSGPEARIALDPLLGQAAAVTLWLHRDVAAAPLDLLRGEQSAGRFAPLPGWRAYHVLLPPGGAAPGADHEWLSLRTPTTVQNGRPVGLPIDRARIAPVGGTSPLRLLGRALQLALPLAGAAALAAALALALGAGPLAGRLAGALAACLAALALVRAPALTLLLPWPGLPALGGATVALAWAGVLRAHPGLLPHPLVPGARRLPWLGGAGLLAAAHLAALLPVSPMLRGAGALVILLAPGALAALLLLRREPDPLVQAWGAVVGGMLAWVPLVWLLALARGLTPWPALLLLDGVAALLALLLWRSPPARLEVAARPRHPYAALAALLILAALLRLPNLAAAEMHVDEARVLLVATALASGQPEALLARDKGPAEVLLAAGPLALTGQLGEGAARLPFALAGLAVVLGVYLLARALMWERSEREAMLAGLAAAGLVAVDGLMIGFSRTVQYQSLVSLLGVTALWCLARAVADPGRGAGLLSAGALAAAVGALAHYDMAYAAPALAWLIADVWRRAPQRWRGVAGLAPGAAIGLALLAGFYLPFLAAARFSSYTTRYLGGRIGGGGPRDNLGLYEPLLTFYTPAPLVALALGLLVAGATLWCARYLPRRRALAACGLLVAGCALQLAGMAERGPAWRLAVAFCLLAPAALLALSRATPGWLRAGVLWFAPSFAAHAFLIAVPNTHFFSAHAPAALLAGAALADLARPLVRRVAPLVAAAGAAALLYGASHAAILFVQPAPEFLRTFPAASLPLFPASGGDRLPADQGFYGFQRQDGWKAVGQLFRSQALQGTYASNQKPEVTGWYTGGVLRCWADPDYYIVAYRESYRMPDGYHLLALVTSHGDPTLAIFSRADPGMPPATYDADAASPSFDSAPAGSMPVLQALREELPQRRLDLPLGGGTLVGVDVGRQALARGQRTVVTAYTRGSAPVRLALLDGAGRRVRALDPLCAGQPPLQWQASDLQAASAAIVADSALPAGTYTVAAESAGAALAVAQVRIGP